MFRDTSYETLAGLLRVRMPAYLRARIQGELRSRDRAMHNQAVVMHGGEFR